MFLKIYQRYFGLNGNSCLSRSSSHCNKCRWKFVAGLNWTATLWSFPASFSLIKRKIVFFLRSSYHTSASPVIFAIMWHIEITLLKAGYRIHLQLIVVRNGTEFRRTWSRRMMWVSQERFFPVCSRCDLHMCVHIRLVSTIVISNAPIMSGRWLCFPKLSHIC